MYFDTMRQLLVVLFAFGTLVHGENVQLISEQSTSYGYLKNVGIPKAESIRKAEKLRASKIVGGVPAALGQYPFQVGLIGDIVVNGTNLNSVCGGTLISASRVLTAAHCWFDGVYQVWRYTAVLGSLLLFSGGTRIQTSAIALHPNWTPTLSRNDIAVIYLPSVVSFSDTIAPIDLPIGSELFESFTGDRAIAIGFGKTSNDGSISNDQFLSHVSLSVIANTDCIWAFPLQLQASHVCTSGLGGVGFCDGDSGGPLIVTRNNRHILIGVAAFRSGLGCEANLPNVFSRVTSFMNFINQHI